MIKTKAISDEYILNSLILSKKRLILIFKKLCWNKIHTEIVINEIREYFFNELK